jgi:hypothetical protein
MAPMASTKDSAVVDSSNSGDMRATMKMPAVTMVAAWISAEIGVGPSIESGSHTCSGHLRGLAHGADEQADADDRHQGPFGHAREQFDGGVGEARVRMP